jgi:arylsulfatase A-like enzyme
MFRASTLAIPLACLAVLLAHGETPPRSTAAGTAARPNVLLVTFDTTRADRLTPFGYRHARMPAIERLAREGVVFTRCYAPTVQTLPSHASMLTGLYPITQNVVSNGQRLDREVLTLPELLRADGYRTGAIVATAPLMATFGLSQGFQTYDDDFDESIVSRGLRSLLRVFSAARWNVTATRPAHRVAALAKSWLRQAARGKEPFFLWVHFIEPHDPYERHPDFSRPNLVVSSGDPNVHGVKEANYVNEIEYADHHLGAILRELDSLGLTRNTATVFTADHGEALGEQGYTGHREEVYESIIRVPLIVRMPGKVPAGARLDTPAQLVDVTPTILPLLGIPLDGSPFQGHDLFSLRADAPRSLYSMAAELLTREPIRIAMIKGTQKFVVWPDSGRKALYHIATDPFERRNLLVSPEDGTRGTAAPTPWEAELNTWWQRNDRLRADDFALSPDDLERLQSLGYIRR